jgi:hypothetical protein
MAIEISGAWQLSDESANYGCVGHSNENGSVAGFGLDAVLSNGNYLNVNVSFPYGEGVVGNDVVSSVLVLNKARDWVSETCLTQLSEVELVEGSSARRFYRIAGVTTCPDSLTGEDIGNDALEPLTLHKVEFVSLTSWVKMEL